MLALSRFPGERIELLVPGLGHPIVIEVIHVHADKRVRLAIEADQAVGIWRQEIPVSERRRSTISMNLADVNASVDAVIDAVEESRAGAEIPECPGSPCSVCGRPESHSIHTKDSAEWHTFAS